MPNIEPFIPDDGDEWHVAFFWPKLPLQSIQNLILFFNSKFDTNGQSKHGLWFSHGLPSTIVIGNDRTFLVECFNSLTEYGNIVAAELWKSPQIGDVEVETLLAPEYKETPFIVPIGLSNSNAAASALFDELVPASARVQRQAETFTPSAAEAAVRVISRLHVVAESETSTKVTKDRQFGELSELHHAFASLLLQGFTGTPPLLQHPGPPIGHSLLGIGRALQGLQAIERHFTNAFTSYSVENIVAQLKKEDPFDVQAHSPVHFSRIWPLLTLTPEDKISEATNVPIYLSMRRAFRETLHSLTAPTLVLPMGSGPEWHSITLSHELLHAYVRAFFGCVIASESVLQIATRYVNTHTAQNALESLQFALLASAEKLEEADHLSSSESTGDKSAYRKLPHESDIESCYRRQYDEMQELIVHKLDYHYTYRAMGKRDDFSDSHDIYLASAWNTWSTVPVPEHKIATYVVRTLCAITEPFTKMPSNDSDANKTVPYERYHKAVSDYGESLERIGNPLNHIVLTKARVILNGLKDGMDPNSIRIRFLRSIYLVDLVERYLCNSPAYGKLRNTGVTITESDIGSFLVSERTNPLGLLRATFEQALTGTVTDPEWISAWQLQVLSSYVEV